MQERKLGIIAGGGSIPKKLIDFCHKHGRDYFVLAIEGNADKNLFNDQIPHHWIRLGQAGTGFAKLKEQKVQDLVMIGTIKRPSFFDIIPDIRTAAFIAKIGAKALGDDSLLKALVNEIESEGILVKGIHDVLPEILAKKGVIGKYKPSKEALIDIKRGIEVATELGKLDVGQAVVVQQGLVLGMEGIEGTDGLITRCKACKRKGFGGVLVKLRKPQQDMRIDLPTIGPVTVLNAKQSGLEGIVVHAENGLIVDEQEVIKLANKNGLFVIGVDPSEY